MLFDEPEIDERDDEAPADAVYVPGGISSPRESAECLGHGEIEKNLLAFFNEGRMPHALIFSGPEGIGKATFAFRLARFLLNNKPVDTGPGLFGEPLPAAKPETLQMPSDSAVFRQIATGAHPDFLLIERLMDEKKGKKQSGVAVEEVRRVTPFLRMKAAHDGGWRVVIVDDADTMTVSSQNAILKILEEPPPRTVLILIAHRPGAMVPTIRSRCRVVPFAPLSPEIFGTLLRREHGVLTNTDIDTLHAVTRGSAGRALAMLSQGGLESVQKIIALLSGWPRWDWPQVHAQAEVIGRGGGEEGMQSFATIMLWIVESIVRARATGQPLAGILNNDAVLRLMNHYPLADWIQICENLGAHFEAAEFANLDNRQAVISAFSVLDYKEAA